MRSGAERGERRGGAVVGEVKGWLRGRWGRFASPQWLTGYHTPRLAKCTAVVLCWRSHLHPYYGIFHAIFVSTLSRIPVYYFSLLNAYFFFLYTFEPYQAMLCCEQSGICNVVIQWLVHSRYFSMFIILMLHFDKYSCRWIGSQFNHFLRQTIKYRVLSNYVHTVTKSQFGFVLV